MHEHLKECIVSAIAGMIDESAFVNGAAVGRFEAEFARYVGTSFCIGLASGLDALRLGLIAAGVEPGAEVIVPAQTFVATLEAVTQAGAKPVVVDVSEADYCLDADATGSAVTDRTAAILPVHLYGQMADMRALLELSSRHRLDLVEDACQAHGAERDGLRAGRDGRIAAFSFYPGKNLGAFGDAGALTTSDDAIAEQVTALREHGQTEKYVHRYEGWTARLDTIQATVLEHKLPLLEGWNEERRAAATFYLEALGGLGDLRLPVPPAGSDPVWHLFVVRTASPEALGAYLRERGIGTGRHYPQAVHLTPAFMHLGHAAGAFPIAEAVAREALSLPIFPGITDAQLEHVVESIREYFAG